MNKKIFKTSVGYAVNSLLPILSWIFWGILVDKDLSGTFSLTYPLQMLWAFIYDLFGFGCYSLVIKDKDSSEDYFQSSLVLGSVFYIVVYLLIAVNYNKFMTSMGYLDEKYVPCCLFSIITFVTTGISTLCSLYYSFKEDEKKASNILLLYNFSVYLTLLLVLSLTRNSIYSSIVGVFVSILVTLCIFIKTFKKFKLKLDVLKGIKYVYSELITSVGMFITYYFGIGKMAYNDFRITFTFSIWTQVSDWVWDVLSNVVPILIRVDTAKGRFNFKKSCKSLSKLYGVLFIIMLGESLVAVNVFDLSIGYLLFFGSMDLLDMTIYLPRKVISSNLVMLGYVKKLAIVEFVSYGLRVFLSLTLPVNIALYAAQLIVGVLKSLVIFVMYKRINNTKEIICTE